MSAILWNDLIKHLSAGSDLDEDQMGWAMREILEARFAEADVTAFLLAMRRKGETAAELAAAAGVLREHMLRWDPGPGDVLDTCGTGGDASGTFNISTATAFVLAGAGVRVVKHGNRAVSSKSGSADVLDALGVTLESDPIRARQNLDRCGLAFCFAPSFHPALKHIAPIRKKLGVATLFNSLGPLANPAGARWQLLGVGQPGLLDVMAGALARLGTAKAFVVHGGDGLDEISLGSVTFVREVCGNEIRSLEWKPQDFGLEPVQRADLLASDAPASARMIQRILEGEVSPGARVVLANAAAGLLVADKVADLPAGAAMARETLTSGAARHVLNLLASF